MRAVIFVDGEKELNQLTTIIDTNYLDFDLSITANFNEFTRLFEQDKVDVVLSQIELKACSTYEIFQLARMYNPEILCIAMGYKDCTQELIKVFNTENIFRFITLPIEYKDDLLNPIRTAFDYHNGLIHTKKDIENMSKLNEKIRVQIEHLNDIKKRNNIIFTQVDKLCSILLEQLYYLENHADKNITIDFINNIYSNYVYYFYNNTESISDSINYIKNRANNSELNRQFKISYSGMNADESEKLALFVLSVITDYINIVLDSYNANVIVGINMNHLLIKFSLLLENEDYEYLMNQVNKENHKILMGFLQAFTKSADYILNNEVFEFRIIIN